MLLRQDFSRGHQCHLVSVFHGDDSGLKSHDGFSRSHIALEQTAHGKRLLHVGGNLFQHTLLRRGGMKRQNFLNSGAHVFIQPKSNAGLRLLLAAFQFESQLNEKQFFEDQPDVRRRAR